MIDTLNSHFSWAFMSIGV